MLFMIENFVFVLQDLRYCCIVVAGNGMMQREEREREGEWGSIGNGY